MQLTATASVKAGLARLHIISAERFAHECAAIADAEALLPWPQPRWDQSGSLAAASVLLSVACLEATANEFFLEAVDGQTEAMQRIGPRSQQMLAAMWDEVDEYSILKKYEVALVACQAPPYDKGGGVYQAAAALIELRNALTHFKPEWDHSLDRHARLRERLKGRFESCVLAQKAAMIWFPHACMGAGCARWSVGVVRDFIVDFCSRLDITIRLQPAT
jgi:hypothetical protein